MQHIFGNQSPAVWELEVFFFQRVAACKLLYRCLVSILQGSTDHQIIRLNSLLEKTIILVGIYIEQGLLLFNGLWFPGYCHLYFYLFVSAKWRSCSKWPSDGWYFSCPVANRSTPKCPSTYFSAQNMFIVLYTVIRFFYSTCSKGQPESASSCVLMLGTYYFHWQKAGWTDQIIGSMGGISVFVSKNLCVCVCAPSKTEPPTRNHGFLCLN